MEWLDRIVAKMSSEGAFANWAERQSFKTLARLLMLSLVILSILFGLLGAAPLYMLLETRAATMRFGIAGASWLLLSATAFFLVDRYGIAGRIRRLGWEDRNE